MTPCCHRRWRFWARTRSCSPQTFLTTKAEETPWSRCWSGATSRRNKRQKFCVTTPCGFSAVLENAYNTVRGASMRLVFCLSISVLILALFVIPAECLARKIRVAIPGYNITQVVFFTAKQKGFYKEEGLDVDLIQMTGTLSNLALMTSEVEFTSVPTAAMTANLRGANLRVLFATFEKPLFWLYTRPNIRDVKSIRGKKVGVGGFNQASY